MALIKCPECELMVSDKAFACPHCGYPFQNIKEVPVKRNSTKRKRLPNGFGQITEIKNRNLRNPFRAMVTVGFDDRGRPISRTIKPQAYFKTYNDAYEALMKYNHNPYMINDAQTLSEVYEKYYDAKTGNGALAHQYRQIRSLWNKLSPLGNIKVRELRSSQVREHILSLRISANAKVRVKSLLNQILDYAMEMDLVEKNVAKQITFTRGELIESQVQIQHHIDFTDNEISILWNNCEAYYVIKMILIQCYMGWRPQELINIKMTNVNLEDWTIKGGMKTAAGTNRIVPIHTRIRPFIIEFYNYAIEHKSNYLFLCQDSAQAITEFTYDTYRKRFKNIIKDYNLNPMHRAHDPRVHFITQCKYYEVDEYAIKYMVGHSIADITEAIYTKRKKEWYASEIEKIK